MHPSRILFWSAVVFLIAAGFITRNASRQEFLEKREYSQMMRERRFKNIYHLRSWFLDSVDRVVPQPVGALVGGILVGARSEIPPDVTEDFKRVGLSHITAISGYNISIISVMLMNLLAPLFSRRRAFWIIGILLIVFLIITGLQASVIRAALMGFFVLFAQRLGRVPTPFHALTIAAAMMVAFNPLILLFDIGFQLSFLATLGLLVISPRVEERFPAMRKLGVFGETAVMTVSAQIFVLPLLIYYFKTFSVVSLPANIVILPMIPWLMFLGFIAGIFGWIPAVGNVLGILAWTLGKIIILVAHWFAGISWAMISL